MDDGPRKTVGRYALYGELAAGGMATVHLGRLVGPVGFSKTVAIKRLHAQFAKDPEFAAMFLDEARLAARIQHPNVVSTLDVVAQSGELFLVLEYVHGETLARLLKVLQKAKGRIPVKIGVTIVANALHGLHAAHDATDEQGEALHIVHRDVSPQNIMIGSDGVARVLDFGVAKAVGRLQSTREGQIKGKLAYMAPEQILSEPVDRRSDLYAAAVVLWEVLAMRRLFDGDNDGAICMQIANGERQPPSRFGEGVSEALDAIVLRALDRAPDKRFASAREMAIALEDEVGLASPRQVGEWLLGIAGETLTSRAERVKEIESGGGDSGRASAAPPSSQAATVQEAAGEARARKSETTMTATETSAKLPASAPPRRSWLGVAGLLALLVVALVAWRWQAAPEPGLASSGARPEASTVQRQAPPSATPAPSAAVPEPPPSAAPQASASVEAPARPAPATRPGRPLGSAKPPAPDCDPPYTVDADGIRKIKPACL